MAFDVRATSNAEEFADAIYAIGQYFGGPLTEERVERLGRVRFGTSEEAAMFFPPIHEALMRERPGIFRRSEAWWTLRTLRMPEEEAANPKRFALLDLDGSQQAYAIYRQFPQFEGGVSAARLEAIEVVGATPQATAEIWRFVLDVDW